MISIKRSEKTQKCTECLRQIKVFLKVVLIFIDYGLFPGLFLGLFLGPFLGLFGENFLSVTVTGKHSV